MKNYLYISSSGNGWQNLAMDEWYLDHVGDDDLVFFLYVNQNAVIIGKNQNPWKECNLKKMEAEGVQLVRRVSGGGAVYHDAGNLNFSFIAGKNRYCREKQFSLILEALQNCGIPCAFSGRNDFLSGDKKFSGNAFCVRKTNSQHHGTLLVSSDLSRLSRYLTVDPLKIRSKGIDSVRARVCNLSEINPGITVEKLKELLVKAYFEEYGEYQPFSPGAQEMREISAYEKRHASWEWRVGATPKFDIEIEARFAWGGVQMLFSLEKGLIREAHVFSDAMNPALPERVEALLCGAKFGGEFLFRALSFAEEKEILELAAYLRGAVK